MEHPLGLTALFISFEKINTSIKWAVRSGVAICRQPKAERLTTKNVTFNANPLSDPGEREVTNVFLIADLLQGM